MDELYGIFRLRNALDENIQQLQKGKVINLLRESLKTVIDEMVKQNYY